MFQGRNHCHREGRHLSWLKCHRESRHLSWLKCHREATKWPWRSRILILSILSLSLPVLALHTDKKEIAYITADGGVYNYKTGINQFDGHVQIDQGTTHLTADRLITKSDNKHKIQEAIAYGFSDLAHYWTLFKPEDPEIHGRARIIRYFPFSSNITLEQQALVTQGENSFQGEVIHYNSANQTIAVPALEKNHAILVYNPDR